MKWKYWDIQFERYENLRVPLLQVFILYVLRQSCVLFEAVCHEE